MNSIAFLPLALLLAASCSGGVETNKSQPNGSSGMDPHSQSMNMPMSEPGESAATRGYKRSMARMMAEAPPYTGDADADFNRQMRVHHIAAIDMAEVQLAHGKDEASKALARKIIEDQKREVAQIDEWLRERGQ